MKLWSVILLLVVALGFSACSEDDEGGDSNSGGSSASAPDAPTSITNQSPAFDKGFDDTPTFTVDGVSNGDDVKLYSDSSCTTEVASGTSSGTSVDLTIATALSLGSYTYYATTTDSSSSLTSACSTASANYEYADCPSEFIEVPGNSTRSVPPFCVMAYEAKDVGGVATSQATGTPWVSISRSDAQTECTDLGADYDLISNQEWLTIADNAAQLAANWDGGTIGSEMYRGHTDMNPNNALSVSNTSDPYDQTGNSTSVGEEQARTLDLDNGASIWDLAGNVTEWIDWDESTAGLQDPPSCTPTGELNFQDVAANCGSFSTSDYEPIVSTYDIMNGVGRFARGTGVGATRGGFWLHTNAAGSYRLNLGTSASANSVIGFRCVMRL